MKQVVHPSPSIPLRIGDVAQLTGITLRTLRYYEELGLIEPDARSKGNFRLYDPHVVQRVAFINSLKKLDFSLDEIREIVGSPGSLGSDAETVARTRNALQVKQAKIAAKLAEMQDMQREVERSLQILDDCMSCREANARACGMDCENQQAHL